MAETNKSFLPRWLQIVLIGRRPRNTVLRIAVLVPVVFLTARYLIWPLRVQGPSMAPTYRENGINFLNRLAYLFHEPRRGDVVAIRLAGRSVMLMKRVIGLPGETVPEPYVKYPCRWDRPPRKLGPNEYFVVGDNRFMPITDHYHGAAERERILGKVLL